MITLKKIDVIGQFGLIITTIFIALIPATRGLVFYGYFFVGGWQLLSAAVHYFNRDGLIIHRARQFYHWTLAILAIVGLSCLFIYEVIFWYLLALLLLSPIMAVWYLVFSQHELQVWKERAWVHLK